MKILLVDIGTFGTVRATRAIYSIVKKYPEKKLKKRSIPVDPQSDCVSITNVGRTCRPQQNHFKGTGIMKRQSTTAKVTREAAALIRRYILATGSGVMVRHRGVECGVTRVFECDGDNRAKSVGFLFHGGTATRAIHCTILKSTLAALQTWANRTDGLGRLVLIDCEDGTVGNAGGRYVVSEPNGLVFDDQPLECPSLATFADDTLGAETVGVWRDGGKVYVDSNRSFDRLSDALEFGRSSGQLAIYDTVDSVCIDC